MKNISRKLLPTNIAHVLEVWWGFLIKTSEFRKVIEKIIENGYRDRFDENDRRYKLISTRYLRELPAEYRVFLINLLKTIVAFNINENSYDTIQHEFMKKSRSLDALSLPPNLWKDLQYLAIRFGMFQCSKIFRDKAIIATFNKTQKENENVSRVVDAFKAAMDESNEAMAMKMIRAAENLAKKPLAEQMLFYHRLCLKNQTSNIDLLPILTHKADRNYSDFISGKSIAIVGPAMALENNGAEIDSHDVVVRLGYKGKNYNPQENKFGKRTDISYYGNGNAQLYIANKSSEFLKDLEWAVFKSDRFFKEAIEISNEKKRCFIKNSFYFSGSPMMMQNAVFDILHYKPKKVKLFNMNFNCAKVTHYKTYMPDQEELRSFLRGREHAYYRIGRMKKIDTGGYAHHDLLSQLNFTRNLWRHGAIEVDRDCERVLRMENGEYLMAMENFHVKPYLSN